MECPNYSGPIITALRWPYHQDIEYPGETLGRCPWCMKPFYVNLPVPKHYKEEKVSDGIRETN